MSSTVSKFSSSLRVYRRLKTVSAAVLQSASWSILHQTAAFTPKKELGAPDSCSHRLLSNNPRAEKTWSEQEVGQVTLWFTSYHDDPRGALAVVCEALKSFWCVFMFCGVTQSHRRNNWLPDSKPKNLLLVKLNYLLTWNDFYIFYLLTYLAQHFCDSLHFNPTFSSGFISHRVLICCFYFAL